MSELLESLIQSETSSPNDIQNAREGEGHQVKLSVRKTSLPQCDFLGLFAEDFIAKDTLVCIYRGNILRTKDALHLEDKSYLMRLGEQCYVDAREDLSIVARYINDCIAPLGWNVRFDKRPEEQCAYVIAIRDIFPGEEIFVDYGKWYWVKLKPVKLSAKQIILIQRSNTATVSEGSALEQANDNSNEQV